MRWVVIVAENPYIVWDETAEWTEEDWHRFYARLADRRVVLKPDGAALVQQPGWLKFQREYWSRRLETLYVSEHAERVGEREEVAEKLRQIDAELERLEMN